MIWWGLFIAYLVWVFYEFDQLDKLQAELQAARAAPS
jgi:hypothetical protein